MSDWKPKDWNIFKELKWKLFMFKIRLWTYNSDKYNTHMRKKYCHYGIHKIRQSWSSMENSHIKREVNYLQCQFCRYKFFTNEDDRKFYQEHLSRGLCFPIPDFMGEPEKIL